jgi:Putative prokaryotic signal transducing protein
MKRIYTAAHLLEAQLVVDLLEQAGIAAHIFNANAMSALGDLPMSAAWPQVWIVQAHQERHARAIIAAYQQPRAARSGKVCAACSEASPGEFELCWNCGAALPVD